MQLQLSYNTSYAVTGQLWIMIQTSLNVTMFLLHEKKIWRFR